MRSLQLVFKLSKTNFLKTTTPVVNQRVIKYYYSQKKEDESNNEEVVTKTNGKTFEELQEVLKGTNEKLEEALNKITLLDQVIAKQNTTAKELRGHLKAQIEEGELARKRFQKEKEQLKQYAITNFAKEMLDVQDNLDRAIQNSRNEDEGRQDGLLEGVVMTYSILEKAFKNNGVVKIDCLNKKYDPATAQSITQVEDPSKEPDTVAFIAQEGYAISDRVLRPARVGIVKSKEE